MNEISTPPDAEVEGTDPGRTGATRDAGGAGDVRSAEDARSPESRSSSDPLISVRGVDKFFGDFQALDDINLRVARQEVIVVIGPSGSGKSTMIRCINRLEEHDREIGRAHV